MLEQKILRELTAIRNAHIRLSRLVDRHGHLLSGESLSRLTDYQDDSCAFEGGITELMRLDVAAMCQRSPVIQKSLEESAAFSC